MKSSFSISNTIEVPENDVEHKNEPKDRRKAA